MDKKYSFYFDGVLVELQTKAADKKMILSSTVFFDKEGISPSVEQCVVLKSLPKSENNFQYLSFGKENRNVALKQEVPLYLYRSMKKLIYVFSASVKKWRTVLKNLSTQDFVSSIK
ncbi:MAG TPA: hypothetical protein P5048_03515 [Chlamydiales bacterium]|nr:hypothetical protein [Chlamydiales bacterium]